MHSMSDVASLRIALKPIPVIGNCNLDRRLVIILVPKFPFDDLFNERSLECHRLINGRVAKGCISSLPLGRGGNDKNQK